MAREAVQRRRITTADRAMPKQPTIEIHRPETKYVSKYVVVSVEGLRPLLTHNPAGMRREATPTRGSNIPKAEDEAEAGAYRTEDGTCAVRGDYFRSALLKASSAYKIKGRQTARGVMAHVTTIEDLVPLHDKRGQPLKTYTIDSRRAVVQGQGIVRSRPRFDEWRCTFTLEYDPVLIDNKPELIIDILIDAGNRIGVGDYRPEKKGPFGRFRVTEWYINE